MSTIALTVLNLNFSKMFKSSKISCQELFVNFPFPLYILNYDFSFILIKKALLPRKHHQTLWKPLEIFPWHFLVQIKHGKRCLQKNVLFATFPQLPDFLFCFDNCFYVTFAVTKKVSFMEIILLTELFLKTILKGVWRFLKVVWRFAKSQGNS